MKFARAKAPPPLDMYVLNGSYVVPGPIPGAATHSTPNGFCLFGTTPSISANPPNGLTGGILWAIERVNFNMQTNCNSDTWKPAVLHAYDATNVHTELYNSSVYPAAPVHGLATKFLPPTVFNGKVYVGTLGTDVGGTQGEVDVFGLCGNPSPCQH